MPEAVLRRLDVDAIDDEGGGAGAAEVVEPGSAGIFGLVGGRKARIKVHVEEEKPPHEEVSAVDKQNELQLAKETLETLLALIPVDGARVSAEFRDGTVLLTIEGDASGLLIGRKGATLDSIQYLLSKMVNKRAKRKIRVVVDSENYRQRRFDALVEMGLRMGEKAKRSRKPVATNLLNAHDRRIVHMALKDDDRLDTKSRGEGTLKKVVIIPKT